MKKLLLLLFIVISFSSAHAQITGSDTACAGYIYSYNVNIPGAVSFTWTLPGGWYVIGGQGTSSIQVNCNDSVGQICVTGFDGLGDTVNTICKTVHWGPGGFGWYVDGLPDCDQPCCYYYYVIPNVYPQGPGCSGGCGNGYQNPNIIFAGFDNPWPSGNYLGQVNGSTRFADSTSFAMTIYVYMVDTTLGINNMILVQGGNGCGPVNNTFYLFPGWPNPYHSTLTQFPNPVCVGDTFHVVAYVGAIGPGSWSVTSNILVTDTISLGNGVMTAVLTSGQGGFVDFQADDYCRHYFGSTNINTYDCKITGSDTVCAGHIYTYTADIPGAATFQWTLPSGWYFISGQGTNSVVVNANDSVGQICVTGYNIGGIAIDTRCKSVRWGGGVGWYASSTQTCAPPCNLVCSYKLQVNPQGPGCPGGCGNGYLNPHVYYAIFSAVWPGGNYLGPVNGTSLNGLAFPASYAVYIYQIDTTLGLTNRILVKGGGCGPVNNIVIIPSNPSPNFQIQLIQTPSIVCIGDTFTVSLDPFFLPFIPSQYWDVSFSSPNLVLISSHNSFNSATYVVTGAGTASAYFNGSDFCGRNFLGSININYITCPGPTVSFHASDTTLCPNSCINFINTSSNATSYLWTFPGGTPSTSTSANPTNICYNTPGLYNATLKATNNHGNTTVTYSNYIRVYSPPTVSITLNNDTLFATQGFSTYAWYRNNSLIPVATNYFYHPSQSGTYRIVITDINGCQAIDSIVYTLTPPAINGSDTVCAGYIYTYTVTIQNAVSFTWKLPSGWYFISGQGTNSIVVNANDSVGQICVTGNNTIGIALDSVCQNVSWGNGGTGWYVNGSQNCVDLCCRHTYYLLNVAPQGSGCSGGCGNGYQNSNIIFAGFDNPWPFGNYLGQVNGVTPFYALTGFGFDITVYVYRVDTTFGTNNMILVNGGNGCGPVTNTFLIPADPDVFAFPVTLVQDPDPVCIGDTFIIRSSGSAIGMVNFFWTSSTPDIIFTGSQGDDSIAAVLTNVTGNDEIDLWGTDVTGCYVYSGQLNVNYTTCNIPISSFQSTDTTMCPNSCTDFINTSQNATSYQWSFPGGIPSSSTSANPGTVCYDIPGNYNVTLIASNNYGSDTLTYTNYILVYSPPSISIIQNNDTLFATQGLSTYAWYFNNSLIPGATNYSYTPSQSGTFSVVATDNNGCLATDSISYILPHFAARINGSDTVCAGYIYSYSVYMPGAVSFIWTLPGGWYYMYGQGTDSIVVNVNDSVGPICVKGYDINGIAVDSVCNVTRWGGGVGWYVYDNSTCTDPPCCLQYSHTLQVAPQGTVCPGNCGNGYANPNVYFAVFDAPMPGGNYLGPVIGSVFSGVIWPAVRTLYVYKIDVTFGLANLILIKDGACGPVTNSVTLSPNLNSHVTIGFLNQTPNPVCIGDTFTVDMDPTLFTFQWSTSSPNLTLIGSSSNSTATYALTAPGPASINFFGTDACRTYSGSGSVTSTTCAPPVTSFHTVDNTLCLNYCTDFVSTTPYPLNSMQWYFPGGNPSSSTSFTPHICYDSAGSFDVTLITRNNYGSDTLTLINYITVTSPPFSLIQSHDTLFVTPGYVSYVWYLNNSFVYTSANSFYIPSQAGSYRVIAVSPGNVCNAFASISYTIPQQVSVMNGSDTVCAGYIYSYSADIAGAVSFTWTLPSGWYYISGQGTDSIVVNANDSVGQICVTGYDINGIAVDSVCKNVTWGTGGSGWFVTGTSYCNDACCVHHYFILNVAPQGSGCSGGCGNGYQNPNLIFAGFDNPWPGGNYLGQVDGVTHFNDPFGIGFGMTVYVYFVDTTFGINNMILVSGGNGCGPVNNTFFIPADITPSPFILTLTQFPDPVCIGDTFVVRSDGLGYGMTSFQWSSTANITFVGSSTNDSIYAILTTAGANDEIYLWGSDLSGCYFYSGSMLVDYAICSSPTAIFNANDTTLCPGSCINFNNTSQNATSYQWSFPGATPASSTSANPTNICYNNSGSYDVTFIATNSHGSDTLTYSNYITVSTPPIVAITQSNDTLFVTQSFSSYSWYFNNNLISGANNYFYAPSQSGTYNLIATDNNGCRGTDSVIYTVPVISTTINGSDIVCAGFIYTYTVDLPGAISYTWTLPTGWYFISGQGTDSIIVNCNDSVGQICVTGYDLNSIAVDSICKSVGWGTGGIGWHVTGNSYCADPCCYSHYFILNVTPQGSGCSGGCGTGYQNPNIIFAAFDNPWPSGNYLGQVNGALPINAPFGIGITVYVYPVDITFGINNLILVNGGNGCGQVNNTFFLSPDESPPFTPLILTQYPNPVCEGDTFIVRSNGPSLGMANFFWFASSNISIVGLANNDSVIAILAPNAGFNEMDLSGTDLGGCHMFFGSLISNVSPCNSPLTSFHSDDTTLCPNTCINFTNTSQNATSYQWSFPGATPSSSTSANPTNICYNNSGNYDVTLIATNSHGSDTLTYSNYIAVSTAPAVAITQSNDTLFATQGFSSYSWYFNNNLISVTNNFLYAPSQSGTYRVIATDNNGCQGTDSALYTVLVVVTSINGSSTVCAGYIYSYTADMPGAVSFTWTLPTGWYFIDGQGTDSIVVNANDSVGQICVTGHDINSVAVDSICKSVGWGGGSGWQVTGNSTCDDPPCCFQHSYTLQVVPMSSGCPGGCGSGYINPNVYFAVFSAPWPGGNYLGPVGVSIDGSQYGGTTVYVYLIDTSFGLPNRILVKGGGCGTTNNTYYIPFDSSPVFYTVPLIQTPAPVCVGDTFVVSVDPNYSGSIINFNWMPSFDIVLIGPVSGSAVSAVVTGVGLNPQINFMGSNTCSQFTGFLSVNHINCPGPTASFHTNDTTLCLNSCIDFINTTQNAASYQWSFPGAIPSISTSANPTNICYNTPGQYDVSVTATNNHGSITVTLSNYITVHSSPALSITESMDTLFATQGFTSYQWYEDSAAIIGASDYFYIALQNDTFNLMVTDSNGCQANGAIEVTSILPPTASFTAIPSSVCLGTCINFSNLSQLASSYQWLFPGATPASDTARNPQNICYSASGNYDVTLIAQNDFGYDTIRLSNYITVYPPPASFTIAQVADTFFAPQNFTGYQWYNQNISIPGANTYYYVFNQIGNYNLVVTDSNGCHLGAGIFVNTITPVALFNVSDTAVCPNTCVNFSNTSQNASNFHWYFPGAIPGTSTDPNPTNICYPAPGQYDVRLIASNTSLNDTLTFSNYMHVFTLPSVTIQLSNDSLLLPPGFTNYQWYHDTTLITAASDYFYAPTVTGDYMASVTDRNGCTITTPVFHLIALNTIDVRNENYLAVFPNPSEGSFSISLTCQKNSFAKIELINKLGQLVYSKELKTSAGENRTEIVNQHLAEGIYLLKVEDEKNIRIKKLVIQK